MLLKVLASETNTVDPVENDSSTNNNDGTVFLGTSNERTAVPAENGTNRTWDLDGVNQYTMRFLPGQLPPVNGFWSLTLYELPANLLSANPLDRYLLNSTMIPQFKRDADNGFTFYIQHESPGKAKEANWLPAPEGPFSVNMRLYWPKAEALEGTWVHPPLRRLQKK